MKISVEKKITFGFAGAMLILLIIAVFGYQSINQSIVTANEIHRSHQVIETMDDLLSSLIDADDGSRKFVSSGDRTSIKLFRGAIPQVLPKLKLLDTLMSEHPAQEKRLRVLDTLVDKELQRVTSIMELHAEDRITAAREKSNAKEGRIRMLGIRRIIKDMDAEENKLLLQRISAAQFHVRTAIILIAAGGLFSFFFVGMSKFVIGRDNLKRQIAEDSLRKSEERFQVAARATNDIIWDWDLGTNGLWLSEPFEQLFGVRAIDFEGTVHSRWHRLHPDDAVRVLGGIRSVIDNGKAYWCDEYRFCRPDGTYADIYDRGYVIYEAPGKPIRMIGSMMDITDRKRAEDENANSRKQLRALAAHIQTVREEEGKRIARKIHDELGQALTGLKLDLQLVEQKLTPQQQPIIEKVQTMEALICDTMLTVQRISAELRPGILELGLIAAIESQIRDFESRTEIHCTFASFDDGFTLEDEARSTVLYRIFQEILTNIARHAQATKVRIGLDVEDGTLVLRVTDNGVGISERQLNDPKSLGLTGMRERALIVGGLVAFQHLKDGGTRVTVRIPLEEAQYVQALSA